MRQERWRGGRREMREEKGEIGKENWATRDVLRSCVYGVNHTAPTVKGLTVSEIIVTVSIIHILYIIQTEWSSAVDIWYQFELIRYSLASELCAGVCVVGNVVYYKCRQLLVLASYKQRCVHKTTHNCVSVFRSRLAVCIACCDTVLL